MELVKYDAACRALAEAKSTDEVKQIHDASERMRLYARQVKNKDLAIDAAEIRLRAERCLGELIVKQKETVGLNTGTAGQGRPEKGGSKKVPPKDAPPTLADAGIGKKLADRARKLAAVPDSEFESQLAEWRDRVSRENERVTTSLVRSGERQQKSSALKEQALPGARYEVLYADPPWRYEHSKTQSREIENQYPTMSLDEICDLPVNDIAAGDAVLFLWTTSPKLQEGLRVMAAWGFEYRTCAVWDKERMGMGYYFRQQHELLLVGTKGTPGTPDPANRPPSVLRERRDNKHSAKPDTVVQQIEVMYPEGRRIELFARASRNGWDVWGNESSAA